MNKKDLLQALAKVLSTRKEANDALETILSGMKQALRYGDKIVLSGFGSFHPFVARAKKGRNPKTGQIIHISPRKKVRFHQAKDLV